MNGLLVTAARRAIVAAGTFALVATPTLAAAQAVGVNAAVRNSVQIRAAGTTQVRPAVLRQRVTLNDEVRTGAASQLQILLLDRSTFTVGSNARLTIDRFVYDPARNSRSVGASVTRGAFRFMSGRSLRRPAGPVSVRTPVASIGVRGTIFEGVVGDDAVRIAGAEPAVAAAGAGAVGDPENATLIILRGPGPRTQGDTRPGSIEVQVGDRTIVLDRPGLALYVPGGGLPPIGPFNISDAGLASFQHLLRTVPAGLAAAAEGAAASTAVEAGGQGPTGEPGPPPPGGGESDGGVIAGSGNADAGQRTWLLVTAGVTAAVFALLLSNGDGKKGPVSP